MIKAKVTATGSYLPKRIVTNKDFVEEFGNETSPEALERLLGTREHRVAADDEWCADLLVKAAKQVLKKAGIEAKGVTQIIVSVTPGDVIEPATVAEVQRKLGATCQGMDIRLSCTGWLKGVDIAARQIMTSNKQERILILAGTLGSRTASFRIVQHRAIFGDGAGAILLEKTPDGEESCIIATEFVLLGQYADVIHWPAPWTMHYPTVPEKFKGYFYMGENYLDKPRLLFELAEIHLPPFIEQLWEQSGFTVDDIELAIIHQPSKPLFQKSIECLGIPEDKTVYNFDKYGNTVSAELPITLDELVFEGRIKRGNLLLLITFGAGITIGGMLLRY